jgi:hypothetical protein
LEWQLADVAADFFVGRRRLTTEAHAWLTKKQPARGNYKRKARPPPKKYQRFIFVVAIK